MSKVKKVTGINKESTKSHKKLDPEARLEQGDAEDVLTVGEGHPAIDQLIELGRERGYVTINDLLAVFPEVERDIDQLEDAYAALLSVGITFLDNAVKVDVGRDDGSTDRNGAGDTFKEENHLAAVDTDDTVGLYLKEVGRVPLLTAPEEVILAKRIEMGRESREELAREAVSIKRQAELQLSIEDGWAAREHLITANSRLVISVAKKYMGRGVPFLDLIQ